MSELCPVCERGETKKKMTNEWIKWEGKMFLIHYEAYTCWDCMATYIDASENDPFAQAKAKYEELYGKEGK